MNLPNKITLSRMLLIPLFIVLFYTISPPDKRWILAGLFVIMALSDTLDGQIARRTHTITRMGALLDPIADKLLALTVIMFYVGNGIPAWMAFLLVGRDVVLLALRSFATEYRITVAVSIWGKLKTTVEMVAFALIILELSIGTWVLGVATALSVYSAVDYIVDALRRFKKKNVLRIMGKDF